MNLPMELTYSHRLGVMTGKVKAFLNTLEIRGIELPAEVEGILLEAILREELNTERVLTLLDAASANTFAQGE